MKKINTIIALGVIVLTTLSACFGGRSASVGRGGEVVGVGGRAFTEPTPYGMTLIKRGFLKMGMEKEDSLWGKQTPVKEISVDGFWMEKPRLQTLSTSSLCSGCATLSFALVLPTRLMAATRAT